MYERIPRHATPSPWVAAHSARVNAVSVFPRPVSAQDQQVPVVRVIHRQPDPPVAAPWLAQVAALPPAQHRPGGIAHRNVKPIAGTELCEVSQLGYCLAGRMRSLSRNGEGTGRRTRSR
jgi:hypothetical protein